MVASKEKVHHKKHSDEHLTDPFSHENNFQLPFLEGKQRSNHCEDLDLKQGLEKDSDSEEE